MPPAVPTARLGARGRFVLVRLWGGCQAVEAFPCSGGLGVGAAAEEGGDGLGGAGVGAVGGGVEAEGRGGEGGVVLVVAIVVVRAGLGRGGFDGGGAAVRDARVPDGGRRDGRGGRGVGVFAADAFVNLIARADYVVCGLRRGGAFVCGTAFGRDGVAGEVAVPEAGGTAVDGVGGFLEKWRVW